MFDETNPKTSKFYCLFFGILPEVICRDFEIFLKGTKFFLKVNEMKPKVTLFHQPLCDIRLEVLKAKFNDTKKYPVSTTTFWHSS
jgi:hypothetical protein